MRRAPRSVFVTAVLLSGALLCTCTSGDETVSDPTVQPIAGSEAGNAADATQPVSWISEYNEARIRGIEQAKPVLLFVTSENCGYCRKMYAEVFQDRHVIRELQQKFVTAQVKLDPAGELAQQLRITMYPTTMIIQPDGTILDYARGFVSLDDMRVRLARISENHDRLAALPKSE